MDDYAAALTWCAEVLGEELRSHTPLTGGITSTMLSLRSVGGQRAVLRLMTNEPWRTRGSDLVRRERKAQEALAATPVPAPTSHAVDETGERAGVAAHLMSELPGDPAFQPTSARLEAMARMLATVHDVRPAEPFRMFQTWAWEAKWVVPEWTAHPERWRRAFALLAQDAPAYEPTFLHRDFSHRNLLWRDDDVCGVVDWVETSTGPAWLDVAHSATNLAVAYGPEPAVELHERYTALTGVPSERYWQVMDVVGFLPPPGHPPMFGSLAELRRLDDWLVRVLA